MWLLGVCALRNLSGGLCLLSVTSNQNRCCLSLSAKALRYRAPKKRTPKITESAPPKKNPVIFKEKKSTGKRKQKTGCENKFGQDKTGSVNQNKLEDQQQQPPLQSHSILVVEQPKLRTAPKIIPASPFAHRYCRMDRPGAQPSFTVVPAPSGIQKAQKLEYLLVMDLEATCDNPVIHMPQEVIEFPCLLLNLRNLEIEDKFHQYVRPTIHPMLSPFCSKLTGIVQAMVDNQPDLPACFQLFENWLRSLNLLMESNVGSLSLANSAAFLTCGDWDLRSLLPKQCTALDIPFPPYFHYWINIKEPFQTATRMWPKGMKHMFEVLDLSLEGRLHSGIDDAHNIARMSAYLMKNYGVVYGVTSHWTEKVDPFALRSAQLQALNRK